MNTHTDTRQIRLAGLVPAIVLSAFVLSVPGWADEYGYGDPGYDDGGYGDTSYSFPRVVEGSATVLGPGGERETVEPNLPILVGDRLWVPDDARLEMVLADRSLLRIEGDAEIEFQSVAYSADTDDRVTVLHLRQGELQLVVPSDVLGDALPQIVTPDATIYVDEPGTYRVEVSRQGWTELVVREGRAELAGERDASYVYAGDMALVEGGSRPYLDIRPASSHDSLERWGERLSQEAAYASVPYVDRSLHYVAAPLVSNGVWVSIGGRHAWRPRVAVTWQPYNNGYWRTTPAGLVWVSYDPWGYVTHHYGLWDYVPGYGWVWYPGRSYRPAWVHWYWGPEYVGWCPSGYYASYYGHHGYGGHRGGLSVGFGIYGWAGGSWSRFTHWSFTATVNFGGHHQREHVHSGRAMAKLVSAPELRRGIITTDPGVGRKSPKERLNLLEAEVRDYRRTTGRELPDVSDYVARKPLARELEEAIRKPKPLPRTKPLVRSKPSAIADRLRGAMADRKPSTNDDKGTVRVSPRDVERYKERVRVAPREKEPPRVTRPSESSRPPVRVSPRDVERYKERVRVAPRGKEPPRVTRPSESSRPPVRVSPRDVERYKERVRVAPREKDPPRVTRPSDSSRPPARISPRDVERYKEQVRVTKPRSESSRPSVSASPSERKPSVKAIKSGKDTARKGSKPAVKAKKPRKKKDH